MPHQGDDTPQSESAGEKWLGAAQRTSARAQGEWPEPEPSLLEDGRPVLPAFPLDVLPQPWREWVSDAAGGAGAPRSITWRKPCWPRSRAWAALASGRA